MRPSETAGIAVASELTQALLNLHLQQEPMSQSETQVSAIGPRFEVGKVIHNLKRLKSIEILRSAVKIFASNFKLIFLMIMSTVPLYAFMIFYEIKLQNTIQSFPSVQYSYHFSVIYDLLQMHNDRAETRRRFFSDLLQICLFYLVLYPLLELFTVIITIKLTPKVHSGESHSQSTLKELLHQNNIKGTLITYLCIHLLSNLSLLGLFWVVLNHKQFTGGLIYPYDFDLIRLSFYLASLVLHSLIFLALLYKYLGWSAYWNMSMVISVLEEETGLGAFGLSEYYGKHCKKTGFQLMLGFFSFGNSLRLPCLFSRLFIGSSFAGFLITAIGVGLVCLVNLVKWVAFVLYFFDCKQQVMEKKVDEEVGESVKKVADVC